MMKFQNNGVWERWAMDYSMLYMCVVLLSIKMDFVRGLKKDMEIFQRYGSKMIGVSEYWG